jgi:autotransporter-associated beta strand protein
MIRAKRLLLIATGFAVVAVLIWLLVPRGAAPDPPDVARRPAAASADVSRAGDPGGQIPVADTDANAAGKADARITDEDDAGMAAAPRRRDPATYVAALDAGLVARWEMFQRRHPDVDPTDDGEFHDAVLAERSGFPAVLKPEDRDAYAAWLAGVETMREAMVAERGRIEGLELRGSTADGREFALTGFHGREPVIMFTENREAAISTAASFVRRNSGFDALLGPAIDGAGFFANINDGGIIAASPEFRNDADTAWRRTNVRGTSTSDHATHVAGTIAARGVQSAATGMAPAAHLYCFSQQQTSDVLNYGMDWPGRPQRSIVANTSLGSFSETLSGVYTSTSASFDSALHDTPYYLHFYSAGNSGSAYLTLTTSRKDAKNLFAVANLNDVSRNSSGVRTGGGSLSSSSSRGPTRDGRIKPDIAANGASLYSPDSEDGYSRKTGTSMASPNAAGSAILLQDYFSKRLGGNLLRASTLMALIINTAEDLGTVGPDYAHGWGLMNTLEAARVIQRHADEPRTRPIREEILQQGETHTFTCQTTTTGPLRATLVWTDPPGPSRSNASQTGPVLVNDLNLRLIAPNGGIYLPFVMPYVTGSRTYPPFSPELFEVPAKTGVNFTDNKIQVLVNAPPQGGWLVEVSHSATLTGGAQRYSLVLHGLESTQAAAAPGIFANSNVGSPGQDFAPIEIFGEGFILGAEVWLRRERHTPVQAYAVETTSGWIRARLDHSAMANGEWTLVVRNPDGLETAAPLVYQVSPDADPTFAWTGGADGTGRVMMASAGYSNWFPTLANADVATGSATRFLIAGRNAGGPAAPIGGGGHLGLNAPAEAGILIFHDASGHFGDDLRIAANVTGSSARQWTLNRPDTTIIELTPATTGRVTLGHDREGFGELAIRLPSGGVSTIHVAQPEATLDLSGLFDSSSAFVGLVNHDRGAIHAGNTDPAATRARLRKTGSGTLDLRTADTHGNRVAGLTIEGGVVVIGKDPDMGWEPLGFMADHVVINGGALHFDGFSGNTGETRGFLAGDGGAGFHVTGQNHGIAAVVGDIAGHAGRVIKTGDAALRLVGENTYSGGTEVREGRMQITTAASLGSGVVTLHDGASLSSWIDGVVLPNPLQVAGESVRFGGDGATTRLAGAVDLGGETRIIHLDDHARLDGPVGNGGLVVAGTLPTHVLHLAGEASLDGILRVESGVLEVSGSIDGDLTVASPATLRITVAAGAAMPRLTVTGSAQLDGTLALVFGDGVEPESGMLVEILDAPDEGIITGPGFAFDLPPLVGDLVWDVAEFPSTGAIRVIDPFTLWADNAGLVGPDTEPGADPDGDGLDNRMEYLLGFDPLDMNSTLRMTLEHDDATTGQFSLRINRVIPAGTFVVETSTDLAGPWANHANLSIAETGNDYSLPVVPDENRRFYRLRFTPPPS